MINKKYLCDGNNISVYSKPLSDKTMAVDGNNNNKAKHSSTDTQLLQLKH
jgi:hypothetical protein